MKEKREREPVELDDIIDKYGMVSRTGLTREELHRRVDKATYCLDIAYCLADVIETLALDTEGILRTFGGVLEREDKMHFKALSKGLQDVRKCARRCCDGLYKYRDADEFADDCDWWYNLIRLAADRVGDDKLKTKQVIEWLDAMPSVKNMFNVKQRDFLRRV